MQRKHNNMIYCYPIANKCWMHFALCGGSGAGGSGASASKSGQQSSGEGAATAAAAAMTTIGSSISQ